MYKEEYAFTFLILHAWLEFGILNVLGILLEGTIECRDFLHISFSDESVIPMRIGNFLWAGERTEEDKKEGITPFCSGNRSCLNANFEEVEAVLFLRSNKIENLTANVRLGYAEGTRQVQVLEPSPTE